MGLFFFIILFSFFIKKTEKSFPVICAFFLQLVMLKGIGTYDLTELLSFAIVVFLLSKNGLSYYTHSKYPFHIPVILFILSFVVSNIFCPSKWNNSFVQISNNCIFPCIVWIQLQKKEQFSLFTKLLIYVYAVIAIYGILELITGVNPFARWMVHSNLFTGWRSISTYYRFGFKRIQSLMIYRDTLGVSASFVFLYLCILYKNKSSILSELKLDFLVKVLLITLPICVLFTGTRACIVCLIFCIFGVLDMKNKKTYKYIFVISLFVVIFADNFFRNILDSFVDVDSVGGSNIDMRTRQLEFCLHYFRQSPIYGHGIGYLGSILSDNRRDILGAESIWFRLMVDQGLLGCLAFLSYILCPMIYAIKTKNQSVFFLSLAYLAAKTLSSIPGIPHSFFMIMVVLLINIQKIEEN